MADNGGSRDVDDISLDDARVQKRSSSLAGIIVVIILVIIVAAAWFLYKRQQDEVRRQREAAEIARQAQMQQVTGNIQEAISLAAAGDVDAALTELGRAESQMGEIVVAANSERNEEAASDALIRKQAITDTRKAIEEARTQYQAAVGQELQSLRATFGITAPATPAPESATPDASAPETQPAAPGSPGSALPGGAGMTAPAPAPEAAPAPAGAPANAPASAPAAPAEPAAPAQPASPGPYPAQPQGAAPAPLAGG